MNTTKARNTLWAERLRLSLLVARTIQENILGHLAVPDQSLVTPLAPFVRSLQKRLLLDEHRQMQLGSQYVHKTSSSYRHT
jgi:hypothetical protein